MKHGKWVQGSARVRWTSLGADKAVTTHEWLLLGEHDQQLDVCMQMMIVAHFSYAYRFHFF